MKTRDDQLSVGRRGYALVSVLVVSALLITVALVMLQVSTVVTDDSSAQYHEEVARANARLSMAIALASLQRELGPDQRVSAKAELLGATEHPHWLGVWDTTVKREGTFPVIGKGDPDSTPYESSRYYSDLREHPSQEWKHNMRRGWLVSGAGDASDSLLDPVTIVGGGTLGSSDEEVDFGGIVKAGKVKVAGGKYAWWIADQNLKADIGIRRGVPPVGGQVIDTSIEADIAVGIAVRCDPEYVSGEGLVKEEGARNYGGYTETLESEMSAASSYMNLQLAAPEYKSALKRNFHDFTQLSEGLQVDVTLGALRRDLTPLLFGRASEISTTFTDESGGVFSSDRPMIPGPDHGVLGPSFSALRHWGLERYRKEAPLASLPPSASRLRPVEGWPYAISDGVCSDARSWPSMAPKVQPSMTDCRWHFYFSHDGQGNIRTHIQPRVCLWNPYNREIEAGEMTVMLPNPFYNGYGSVSFFLTDQAVQQAVDLDPKNPILSEWKKEPYRGGLLGEGPQEAYQFKIELQRGNVENSLFPGSRFLAFTVEASHFGPGENLVFLPKILEATESAEGTKVALYDTENPSQNLLSTRSIPSESHHVIHEMQGGVYKRHRKKGIRRMSLEDRSLLDLGEVFDYQISSVVNMSLKPSASLFNQTDNFACILKKGSTDTYDNLSELPTMQLLLNGSSGVSPSSYYEFRSRSVGYAGSASFGYFGKLETFAANPTKGAPNTHGFGSKLLWFDESSAETGGAPYRAGKWDGEHLAVNPASIANWNMRAQLITRSPACQSSEHWAGASAGAWMTQFNPLAPNDIRDQPIYVEGKHKKNPFGSAQDFISSPDVILFDLPHSNYGALSLGALRHAQLSPFSWNPSYLIGHSLRDLHAPSKRTAHPVAVNETPEPETAPTAWDYMLGGFTTSGKPILNFGPRASQLISNGLLQIGSEAVSHSVEGVTYSSEKEVLAYDIAYEVNQNLWDRYFLSGLPLDDSSRAFSGITSWNPNMRNMHRNHHSRASSKRLHEILSSERGLDYGFWRNSQYVTHRGTLNVNSLSVPAWTAFLSATLSSPRPLDDGGQGEKAVSYARYRHPDLQGGSETVSPEHKEAWQGARSLSAEEIQALAQAIVLEVKARGPFLSVSDFINRRLGPDTEESSKAGVIEHAIHAAGLNSAVRAKYDSTNVDVLGNQSEDNNLAVFRESYLYRHSEKGNEKRKSAQPRSKAWGIPAYLIQSDLLECLAPAIAVRGDTFLVRAYGESSSHGVVHARAYLEASVQRSTEYMMDGENDATDSALMIDPDTGTTAEGPLSEYNRVYGRRFHVMSTKWISHDEI